ncbi:MAG: hypothetical protein WBS14_10205, partial [Rhodomicrobium sp.]
MVSMFVIGLFIGLFYADRVRSLFRRMREALRKLLRLKPDNQPVAALEPAEEPLAIRLRKLESQFLPVAENAAHPREFLDQPSFQEAAALFKSEVVPLK